MAPMPSFLQQAAQNSGGEWVRFDDNSMNVPVTIEINAPYQIRAHKYQGKISRYNGGPNKGKPKYEMVISGLVNGEQMNLATGSSHHMDNAIARAVQEAGAEDLQIGGKLTVTYTGKQAVKGANPAKIFSASYEPNPEGKNAYNESADDTLGPDPEEEDVTYTQGGGFSGGAPGFQHGGQQGGFQGQPQGFPQGGGFQGAPQGFPQGGHQQMGFQQGPPAGFPGQR